MPDLPNDIHEQLRAVLNREGATYRVIEHEPEGRTEVVAGIRGNRIEQSIMMNLTGLTQNVFFFH